MANKSIFIPVILLLICSLIGCDSSRTTFNDGAEKGAHPLRDDHFTNSIGMEFKRTPAGSFYMGSPVAEKNRNSDEGLRLVEIKSPFYLGIYEVTQAQWRSIMSDNPSYFKGDDQPVEQVSWIDVSIFIDMLNAKEQTNK